MVAKAFAVMIIGQAKEGTEAYIRGFMHELIEHSQKDEGCLQYNIHVSNENPLKFMLYSLWKNQTCFDKHNQTPYLQEFREQIAKHMFETVSEKSYWELI